MDKDSNVIARVLLLTDQHKRDADISTIKGYSDARDAVADDVYNFVKNNEVTHVIHLGDLYDRGYQKVDAQYVDTLDDIRLSDLVGGNYYGVIGNHLYLERDSNPEFYLIQPNKYKELQPLSDRTFRKAVIKVTDDLVIGSTQISFFHFSKESKAYKHPTKEGVNVHIGLYHDDCVIPNSARSSCNLRSSVSSTYLNDIYSNIDVAFIGHVHPALGVTKITLQNGRTVPIYIQGAMTITSSAPIDYHKEVNLPILDITKTGCTMRFVRFSLHTEMLTIYRDEEKVNTYQEKEVYTPVHKRKALKLTDEDIGAIDKCVDVGEYISSVNAGSKHVDLYKLAVSGNLTNDNIKRILDGGNFEY